jgi:hypothetical protein
MHLPAIAEVFQIADVGSAQVIETAGNGQMGHYVCSARRTLTFSDQGTARSDTGRMTEFEASHFVIRFSA